MEDNKIIQFQVTSHQDGSIRNVLVLTEDGTLWQKCGMDPMDRWNKVESPY